MSVLIIDANKNGKYIFTKEELQALLDKVEQEAFERGVAFEKARKPEKEYVYLNSPALTQNPLNPYANWNEVTCKSVCADAKDTLGCHFATESNESNHVY